MNPLVMKESIQYAHFIVNPELQQTLSVSVNVRVFLSYDNTLPRLVVSTHVCIEITQ